MVGNSYLSAWRTEGRRKCYVLLPEVRRGTYDGGCDSHREGKCHRLYAEFFLGEGSEGRRGREVEEILGCRAREAQTLWGPGRR